MCSRSKSQNPYSVGLKSPDETEAFLLEWKDSAARLIFQYATEKMTPEQKARFKKSK